MDAQTTVEDVAAVAALVHSLARDGAGAAGRRTAGPIELIEENRFLAARDGMDAELIDIASGARAPAREQLDRCWRPARNRRGGSAAGASSHRWPSWPSSTGAERQLASARGMDLRRVAAELAAGLRAGRAPSGRAGAVRRARVAGATGVAAGHSPTCPPKTCCGACTPR